MNTTANTTLEKFTSGPWCWLGGNAIWDNTNHLVATSVVYKEDLKGYADSKGVQNAKLIAAAPDLYKACCEMIMHLTETDFDVCGTPDELLNKWKAAIQKATE